MASREEHRDAPPSRHSDPPPGPPPGPPPSRPHADSSRTDVGKAGGTKKEDDNASRKSSLPKSGNPSGASHSNAKRESGEDSLPEDPIEMEKKLSRERMSFFQELEMDRVLAAFKLNPYDILECPMEADDKTIHKIYRRKSLLIHPDKVKDPRAESAFALLKQASTHLLDEGMRKALDETVMSARALCLKDLGLPPDTNIDDKRLQGLAPSFDERVRKGTKEIMIDDELRKRRAVRLQHAAEGEVMRKREEAAEERKRKVDEKEEWERTRDGRISDWRAFQQGSKKKKKSGEGKIATLG